MRKLITLLFLLYIVALPGPIYAQEPMSAAEQKDVIDSLTRSLADYYVFPGVAKKMGDHLLDRYRAGAYDKTMAPVAFAHQLTEDLRSISHDLHLGVRFDPDQAQSMRARRPNEAPDGPGDEMLKQIKRDNYGFKEVKIMEGNVGYIQLLGFVPPLYAGETAAAAMNLLAHADAIIFDLRRNGGGDPAMIQLLTSYLYPADANIHLNSFYFRPRGDTTQTWTLPYVPGQRNPKAEVFILTSRNTFSAAEEFTYNLKNLQKATIVGETTGGGAHPGGHRPIAQRFVAFVPDGRAINPITHTNWEGVGVSPHVETEADKALAVAHTMAVEQLAKKAQSPEDQQYYNWYARYLGAKSAPVELSGEELQACTGQFGPRNLFVENGKLFYQRTGRAKMELLPLDKTTFAVQDDPSLRFVVEMKKGRAAAIVLESAEGWQERNERNEAKP